MGMVNRKRIARNTLLLYLRMGLTMLVSLYSSRIVLSSLGETDFGLYNVIGGIVVMFAFLNGVMNAACNRYYSVAMGKQDDDALHRIFSVNVVIFLILGAAILVLCETVGLWLLETKMSIPADRMTAARWVYQISILSFLAGVIAIPFRSLITAKEKMKVYTFVSVAEALLKLGVALLLASAPIDRLIYYAALMLAVGIISTSFYISYCRHNYTECKGKLQWEGPLAGEIVRFNLWGVLGSMATIGKNQGVNILLNIFYGPAVNAARGIANQVNVNVFEFVHSYVLAFNPQIVKSYAAGEKDDMLKLVFQSSKFSYYLLFVIALPLILEMKQVLGIWLVDVPEHCVTFATIMMLTALIDANHDPLYYSVQASGRVKWYNILVGGSQLMVVVLAYLILKLFTPAPEMVFYLIMLFTAVAQVIRIVLTHRYVDMSIREYIRKVIVPIVLVSVCSCVLPAIVVIMMPESIGRLLLTIAVSLLSSAIVIYTIGLDRSERETLTSAVKSKFHRK